jgi:hypothetical protein
MLPTLADAAEACEYLYENMETFVFRAYAQRFLPKQKLDEFTEKSNIERLILSDKDLPLDLAKKAEFAEQVFEKGPKLFATCIYSEMPMSYLKHLFDGGLSDQDIASAIDERYSWMPRCSRSSVNHFTDNRKLFNAACFKTDSFQTLDANRAMPVAFDEEGSIC